MTLPWANKFRELVKNSSSSPEIIMKFTKYCDEQERKLMEAWKNGKNKV
ncbi:MAG: hypothetical protein WC444_06665 [Candidatus Paceibacterota bacterium]